jgi:putative Mg2+ transporter-C (MgtC) family protein
MNAFVLISIAMALGMCLGLERSFAKKTAGMRTYALVSTGAALFIIIARLIAPIANPGSPGQLYVLQGLIMGIGFIGGGAILRNHEHRHEHASGITTAAGLWITSGIGAAVGFGMVSIAVFTTMITLFIFIVMWFIEHYITKNGEGLIHDGEHNK